MWAELYHVTLNTRYYYVSPMGDFTLRLCKIYMYMFYTCNVRHVTILLIMTAA